MKRNPQRPRRGGFTLVEMLIVLGILVLLASLALPRLLGSQRKADIKAAQTQVHNFKSAIDLYVTDCRSYPTTDQGLAALVRKPDDLPSAASWGPDPYLESIPKDPWGHEYQYVYPSEHGASGPDIWSYGPDGEDGSDDDIVSWDKDASTDGQSGNMNEDRGGKGREPAAAGKSRPPREPRGEPRDKTGAGSKPSKPVPASKPVRSERPSSRNTAAPPADE